MLFLEVISKCYDNRAAYSQQGNLLKTSTVLNHCELWGRNHSRFCLLSSSCCWMVHIFKPNVICSRMMLWTFNHYEQIHNHQTTRRWHLRLSPPRPQSGVWWASCYKKVRIQKFTTTLLNLLLFWIALHIFFGKSVILLRFCILIITVTLYISLCLV